MLGVAPSGFFYWRTRPPSARELRSEHLGGLISDIHHASNGTYGTRRVTAELRFGYELTVNRKAAVASEAVAAARAARDELAG
jgi:putative transposase